jgi:hypothetical protein
LITLLYPNKKKRRIFSLLQKNHQHNQDQLQNTFQSRKSADTIQSMSIFTKFEVNTMTSIKKFKFPL